MRVKYAYSPTKTLWKGVKYGVIYAAVSSIEAAITGNITQLSALVSALVVMGVNVYKHLIKKMI